MTAFERPRNPEPSGAQDDDQFDAAPGPLWPSLSIWAGGLAVVAALWAGYPSLGGGRIGGWRIVLNTLGLLAIAVGMSGLLWNHAWHIFSKAALIVAIVTGLWALSFFVVDQVPVWPSSCTSDNGPTLENRGPVYCLQADGTLLRRSITDVRPCFNGGFSYASNWDRAWGWSSSWWVLGWASEGSQHSCPL